MEINEKFITNSKYTTDEKCVYLNLLSKSNDFITCVSHQMISKELNLSRRTIIRNIKTLEEKQGIIKIKGVTETGGASSNTYILTKINDEGEFDEEDYQNKLNLKNQIFKNINNHDNNSIVKEYLKDNNIEYLEEYDTLKCINPLTNKILPYDIELKNKKIIIELQGLQHTEYSKFLHDNKENYEYRVWKDWYKKSFAEKQGYKVLQITSLQIQNEEYKNIIKSVI